MASGFDIHPDIADFVRRLAALPAAGGLDAERRAWREFCLATNPPRPGGMTVEDVALPLAGRTLAARIYRPARIRARAPAVLYLHGGGWVLGDLDTQDGIAAGLAEGTAAVVVSLDYRLAPEHPYPAAFDDARDALAWLHREAGALGVDASRIALCGDSAGGNLAAAVSLDARDHGGPAIAAQCLVYPVLDTDTGRPSYRRNAAAPMLGRDEMIHYLDAYLGSARDAPPATAMPLRAVDLSGLPPALVHTAEHDPLCDEGLAYHERLLAAGTPSRYRCARRMPHSFLRARGEGPAPAAEFEAICAFLREHLAG